MTVYSESDRSVSPYASVPSTFTSPRGRRVDTARLAGDLLSLINPASTVPERTECIAGFNSLNRASSRGRLIHHSGVSAGDNQNETVRFFTDGERCRCSSSQRAELSASTLFALSRLLAE